MVSNYLAFRAVAIKPVSYSAMVNYLHGEMDNTGLLALDPLATHSHR